MRFAFGGRYAHAMKHPGRDYHEEGTLRWITRQRSSLAGYDLLGDGHREKDVQAANTQQPDSSPV